LDDSFFKHQIHWFSVFNSFMMVIFLVGLVAMILMRTLRRDYARYAHDEEGGDDDDMPDESGWKQVHGDVFRAPRHLVVFSALIGTGYQLAILCFLLIIFSIVGTYYVKRGTLVSVFVFFYALTSFVAGYAGGGFYARSGGKLWITNMLIIAGLFPGLILTLGFLLNFVAIAYGSLAAIPVGSMAVLLCIWLFISFPLTVVGTIIGKNYDGRPDNPCRVNPVPRHIPPREWYLHPLINILLGGILPFGSLFIELYFVFTAFWHYKYYYVYGFMLLVYMILIIVTVCVTIVSTYFLLNAEDYRWHWSAFLSASSTSFYVYLYSVYYFVAKTNMSGLFQTSFYFGYMLMFCIGLGILTGSVGYLGASFFVHRIYSQVKLD
jgi:transmembrane 9 superfamily protein 3